MQDIDRPAHVQPLPQPTGTHRPSVETKPLRVVSLSKGCDRVSGHRSGRRDLGQDPAVWSMEPKRAVRLPIDPKTLFVDRAMVPATQQGEIRKRGGATFRPMAHVMSFAERESTAWETAPVVPVMQRTS
jgi:hypothetical protein